MISEAPVSPKGKKAKPRSRPRVSRNLFNQNGRVRSISMDAPMIEEIEKAARESFQSFSAWVADACRVKLRKVSKKGVAL